MSNKLSLLKRAASLKTNKSDLPNPSELVQTLLDLEKLAKKEKTNYAFSDLIGCWNLRFITGTKKSRKKAGIALGAGRYIPKLIKIKIIYQADSTSNLNTGRVKNSVRFAFLDLALTGPVKFLFHKNNILAFDFTSITVKILGFKIYDGYLKNGAVRDREFFETKITQQAFFSYFSLRENSIAARGRGGGLALWGRCLKDEK